MTTEPHEPFVPPTAEQFLEMYRPLVEGCDGTDANPMALPMLFVDGVDDTGADKHVAVGIVGAPPHIALPILKEPLRKYHPKALTFSTEAWSRVIDMETGEERPPVETVVILHVEVDGTSWLVEQGFVRSRDGVRWLEVRHADQSDGRIEDALRYLLEA